MTKESIAGRTFINGERFLIRKAYHIELSEQSERHLKQVRNHLGTSEGRDRSVLLYFNHLAYNDPVLAAYIGHEIDQGSQRRIFAPMSASSSRLDPKNFYFLMMVAAGRLNKVRLHPIIQAYQVGDPYFGYTEQEALGSYKSMIRTLKRMHAEGPVTCLLSPEGTRSRTGYLADSLPEGITRIGRIISPLLYVPLGIDYPDGYTRGTLNIGRRVHLAVGEPIFQDSIAETPPVDLLMHTLADTLPVYRRGRWGSQDEPSYNQIQDA